MAVLHFFIGIWALGL